MVATAPASASLLIEAFGRVPEALHEVLDGLDAAGLSFRPDPEANSIGWLLWHFARVEDDHVAAVAGTAQVWTAAGFHERFDLPFAVEAIGYGHTAQQVGAVQLPDGSLVAEYYDAVHEATLGFLGGMVDADLDRVVDERWDPPVTLSVRLVSVLADALQHVGQAAYVRGVYERTRAAKPSGR
ncbi:MAG: mycothiol transferase [Gemmatimonadales bacterium]